MSSCRGYDGDPFRASASMVSQPMRLATRPVLRRLLALDRLIRSRTFPNARTAARELEVHPRTIHRDLDFLRCSWNAPLEYSRRHKGFFYRDPDYALPVL